MKAADELAAFDCEVKALKKWLGIAALIVGQFAVASIGQSAVAQGLRGGGDPYVSDVASATAARWQYGALAQGGVGLEDRTNFGFFSIAGRVSRKVTPVLGSGVFAGQGEYGVEVYPFWQSYTPRFQRIACPAGATAASQCAAPYTVGGTFTGVSVTPIQLRYDFVHGRRVMPWVQGGGGVVWTPHQKYPAVGDLNAADPTQTGPGSDTSDWNFTPQFGVGMHYFTRARRSLDFGVNAVHISSASLGDKNPGVNISLQMTAGYTWWK